MSFEAGEPLTVSIGEIKSLNAVMYGLTDGDFAVGDSKLKRFINRRRARHIIRENNDLLELLESPDPTVRVINIEIASRTLSFVLEASAVAIEAWSMSSDVSPGTQETISILRGMRNAIESS